VVAGREPRLVVSWSAVRSGALERMQWEERVWRQGKGGSVGHRAVFTTRRAMSVPYGGVRRVSLPCRECTCM